MVDREAMLQTDDVLAFFAFVCVDRGEFFFASLDGALFLSVNLVVIAWIAIFALCVPARIELVGCRKMICVD